MLYFLNYINLKRSLEQSIQFTCLVSRKILLILKKMHDPLDPAETEIALNHFD